MRHFHSNGHLSLVALALCLVSGAIAETPGKVAINITTTSSAPLAPAFSGFNVPQLRNGVEYYDPKFVTAVTPLKPGWLRFPAGTASMAYDWNPADAAGGHINIPWMNSLIAGNPPLVTGQSASILTNSQILTQAKGGVWLSDFTTFAQTFGSPAIICLNGYTDTNPDSAGLLAQAAQAAGLNVLEWELANEPYVYPLIFPTAASYASAMYNPYYQNLISGSPQAVAGVFFAGLFPGSTLSFSSWDNGMAAYTPQYWNAVSTHVYPIPNIQSPQNTIETLNGILAYGSSAYITSYLNPLVGSNTPIYVTELNCCAPTNNLFLSYLYNGIFLAEYIARLSSVPNVKGVGINSLYTDNYDYHGLIQSVNDYESYLKAQVAANPNYSTNTASNPNTQFQFYMSAPGLAMEVANQAINDSTQLWPTTVTGGPLVPILGYNGSPIPALFAQGYMATNGSHHVLITNKSSSTCSATIQLNGVHVTVPMTVTFVSNPTALVANTAQTPNNVQIQSSTLSNPISIGPYSVTVVSW